MLKSIFSFALCRHMWRAGIHTRNRGKVDTVARLLGWGRGGKEGTIRSSTATTPPPTQHISMLLDTAWYEYEDLPHLRFCQTDISTELH